MKKQNTLSDIAQHIIEIHEERAALKGTRNESAIYDDHMDTIIDQYRKENPDAYMQAILYLSHQ